MKAEKGRARHPDAIAYDRPAVMPVDPAEIARACHERRFVSEKRRAGVSWANIARMLGRCEADVRRDHGALA